MARVINADSFQLVLKQFKGLLTKAQMKKATTDDLLELKETIELAATVLNEQVQKLSCIKLGQSNIGGNTGMYTAQSNTNDYSQFKLLQDAVPPIAIQGDVGNMFSSDNAITLFDLEADINEKAKQNIDLDTMPVITNEIETERLNAMFSSIQDA
jgi:hypothetical protein